MGGRDLVELSLGWKCWWISFFFFFPYFQLFGLALAVPYPSFSINSTNTCVSPKCSPEQWPQATSLFLRSSPNPTPQACGLRWHQHPTKLIQGTAPHISALTTIMAWPQSQSRWGLVTSASAAVMAYSSQPAWMGPVLHTNVPIAAAAPLPRMTHTLHTEDTPEVPHCVDQGEYCHWKQRNLTT